MKRRSIFDLHDLFRGKSFVDVALAIRKMKSPRDLIPELMKTAGLTQRDIDNAPVRIDKGLIDKLMALVPDRDDDPLFGSLPDQVSNMMHYDFSSIAVAYASRLMGGSTLADGIQFGDDDLHSAVFHKFANEPARRYTCQVSFLWNSFKLSNPSIDILTKDAFDLVESTKLDANVTSDMVELAFPHDIFLSMQKPLHGYMELSVLRRGNKIHVFTGRPDRTYDEKTDVYREPYMLLGSVDLEKQIGNMTKSNISESVVESVGDWDEYVTKRMKDIAESSSKKLGEVFGKEALSPADYEKSVREYIEQGVNSSDDSDYLSKEMMGEYSARVADIVIFIMKLRLMMTAEKAPIEMTSSVVGQTVHRAGVQLPPGKEDGLSFSVISLTREFEEARRSSEKSDGGKLDKFGKKVVEKTIPGFIRRQHYGKGNALTKYVYISPFVNRFWCNTGIHITKIVK